MNKRIMSNLIIKPTIGDDQINSGIIFDYPGEEVSDGQVEQVENAHDQRYAEIELLVKNVQKEIENQGTIGQEVKQRNALLTKELEKYKKSFNKCEDMYLDDIIDLEEKIEDNENMIVKMSHSLQAIHMLGTKPNSFYDSSLKNGLGYKNHYTLKKPISLNPKLYDSSSLRNSTMHVHVCDTEKILEDENKSRLKIKGKFDDPIAIEKKVNFVPINYTKMNKLYETFVPQVELSLEQKYISDASTSIVTSTNTTMINLR
ncbi:hypothetical protein Tco_1276968 [Tanacetum coccineum]